MQYYEHASTDELPNVTPIIEVLAVILLVMALQSRIVSVELPVAAAKSTPAASSNSRLDAHVLEIRAQGAVVLNGKAAHDRDLPAMLSQLPPKTQVIVLAESHTTVDRVLPVVLAAHGAGLLPALAYKDSHSNPETKK